MSGDVTVGLIRALVNSMHGATDASGDWEALVMVVEFHDGKFSGASGSAHLPGGVIAPVASDAWAIEPAVTAYTDSYYQPGEPLPVRSLVQFDRRKGKYEVTFEDTDETRWKVTPRNLRQIRETLRPRFE